MNKLVVAYIIENDEDVFDISFLSIKDYVDEILIIDGNRTPNKSYSNMNFDNIKVIHSPYEHENIVGFILSP